MRAKKIKAYPDDPNSDLFIFGATVIREKQLDYIYDLHERTRQTIASIVREALDLLIAKHEKDLDKSRKES